LVERARIFSWWMGEGERKEQLLLADSPKEGG